MPQLNHQNSNIKSENFFAAPAETGQQSIGRCRAVNIGDQDGNQFRMAPTNTAHKPLHSILVKPAGPDCNLACSYCFYRKKAELFPESQIHRMSPAILDTMIRQVMHFGEAAVSFSWQGGEPTLMQLPFFQQAVALQQRYARGQTVGNGLQTNGILIDLDWAKFLKAYNFLIGISLDGPAHIHNHYRIHRDGSGTFDKVVDHTKLLLDTGVAVNALAVVNDYSVQFPGEIYEFHKSLGLSYQQYIPCVETAPGDRTKTASFSVAPEKYGVFLCTLFDLWLNDFKDQVPTTSIRFFDAVFYHYVGLPPPECTLAPECGEYVVVEHNGDVYACDFFVEPTWKLGNILTGNLKEFLNSERQREFGRLKAAWPELCRSCKWLKYCNGGCPKDRIRDRQLSHFCQSYQMFYAHADQSFRQLAERWSREQMKKSQLTASPVSTASVNIGRNAPCPCGSGKKYKQCCGGK